MVSGTLPNGAVVTLLGHSGAEAAGITLAIRSPLNPGSDQSRVFLKTLGQLARQQLACGLARDTLAPPMLPTAGTTVTVRDPLLLLTVTTAPEHAGEALHEMMAVVTGLAQADGQQISETLRNPAVLERTPEEAAVGLLLEGAPRLTDQGISVSEFVVAMQAALSPDNLCLAACLPGDSTQFAAASVSELGDIRGEGGRKAASLPTGVVQGAVEGSGQWARIAMILGCPVESAEELAALEVASTLVGEARFSRLYLAARDDRALTYDIESHLSLLGRVGIIAVTCSVDKERAAEAVGLLTGQIRALASSGPSEAELQAAKRYVGFKHQAIGERAEKWSAMMAARVGNMGPTALDSGPVQALDSVTREQVRRILAMMVARWGILSIER